MSARLACLGLLLAARVAAAPLPGCDTAVATAAADLPATPAAIDAVLRAEPERALAAACAAWPQAAPADQPWLQVQAADALYEMSRLPPAQAALQALQARVADDAESPGWRAHWHTVAARIAFDETEYDAAARHFDSAAELLRRAGLQRTRLAALVMLGQSQIRKLARDLEGAERLAAEAESLLNELGLGLSMDMGDVLNARTMVAYARQDLPGTARLAQAEIDLARAIGRGDDPELLHGYATLGAVLSQLGRFAEADAALQQGLALIARHPEAEPSGQLGIYTNLAMLYLDQGRHDAALDPAQRAVERAEQLYGRDSPRLLTPLMARGQVQLRAARYASAGADLQRALVIADAHRASVGPLRAPRLRDLLASLYIQLGDLDRARQVAEAGLAEQRSEDAQFGYWRGRLLRRRALVALREGGDAQAEAWLAEAWLAEARPLIAAAVGDANPYVTQLVSERCVAQVRLGGEAPACDELRARLQGLADAAPAYRFHAHAALAQQQAARGDASAALQHHLAALAAAERDGAADPRWAALDALAQHLRAHGEPQLAVLFGKQALGAIEALRREAAAAMTAAERGFLVDKVAVYRRVADWLAEDGRLPEALQTLRLLKEEEFRDFVQHQRALDEGGGPGTMASTLTEQEQWLLQRWPALKPGAADGADGETEWTVRAAAALPALSAATPPRAGAERAAAPGARPGELVVYALEAPRHLTLVFESTQGVQAQRLAWDRARAAVEIGRLLAALGRGDPAPEALAALHRQVGEPIERAARRSGARRIVLAFDGALRYVPLAALADGGPPLGERYTVVHRVVARSAAHAGSMAPPELVAMGVSQPTPGQPGLPGVAREVCAIVDGPVHGLAAADGACAPPRGIVRGSGWLNDSFTWQRLADAAAGGSGLLHVGTHFDLRPGNIGRSTLLLGDGSRVALDALAQLDFSGQELVTLSACETGLGGGTAADGREVEGLNLLILRRGARAVLATLWRVDDESTSVLMRAFYRELKRTDAAEALRRAQAQVRAQARWAVPAHWAAFYVTTR